jgi:hypothetical protein
MKSATPFSCSAPLLAALALAAATGPAQAPPTLVGSTSPVQTATLTFTESATVASINVLTQGAPNLDFQFASGGTCAVGTAYTSGQMCTVKYTFKPTHPGPRYGAVAMYDSSSPAKAAATTYLEGTGDGPQLGFGPAVESTLGSGFNASGGAVDGSANIFVVDSGDNTLKEIPAAGGYANVITLVTGFNGHGPAIDGAGNVFVADSTDHMVREVVAAGGYTRVLNIASSINAIAVAVDGSGNLFVATQNGANSAKELTAASGYSSIINLGGGNLGSGCDPSGIAVDGAGNVYISDHYSHHVKKILVSGGYTTVKIIGPALPPSAGSSPGGVAVDAVGDVFVTAWDGNTDGWVEEFIAQGGYATTRIVSDKSSWGGNPALDGNGNIYAPHGSGVGKLDVTHPSSLTFATTAASSTSTDSPQTVTVTNIGNKPLNISGVSYGHDFPEASGVSTDCTPSTSLGISGSCTLSIDFSPLRTSATGSSTPLSEQVTLTDNNLNVTNAEQAVAVSGTETFTAPALTTPTPGTVIGSSSATFTWNPGSATTFQFRLGTTPGSNNIYGSGQTNATSETVSNLPTGVNIYAVLYYMLDGAWKSLDYTYPGTPQAPKLTTPAPGSTLSSSTVTFSWNPGTATTFQFRLGTTLGSNNIYGSGQTTKTSETVSNLPTNGETIHAVLYYMVNGAWQYTANTYTAQ